VIRIVDRVELPDVSAPTIDCGTVDRAAPRAASERAADAELLARLVEGDATALREAYTIHSSLVFGLARKVTGDHATACDITQDVFVHLWERPERVDLSRGSLRAYLGVVAHRRALDVFRSSGRSRAREERVGREEPLTTTSHEAAIVDADDALRRSDRLRAALRELPGDQRQALELAYFGGRTYREVADELGIPEGTAKSRLRLALARLRALIDAEDT
jgi:RNA polymerase sigma-70 factor, ECF subfamily